jgi:hypothetical protein|tara:strand:+ start:655 stop:762 length:108 start_codon:yes stop_codon:yes gene_type:complete
MFAILPLTPLSAGLYIGVDLGVLDYEISKGINQKL